MADNNGDSKEHNSSKREEVGTCITQNSNMDLIQEIWGNWRELAFLWLLCSPLDSKIFQYQYKSVLIVADRDKTYCNWVIYLVKIIRDKYFDRKMVLSIRCILEKETDIFARDAKL